jgi:ribosome-binding factor A
MGRASQRRTARVGSLLQETLAELIAQELNDPRLGMWTITGVRTSPDLGYADVSISTLAGGAHTETAVQVLNKAAPLLWNRVRTMTDLRTIPKLRFNVDRGGEYLDEIANLIEQLPPATEDYGPEATASEVTAGEEE